MTFSAKGLPHHLQLDTRTDRMTGEPRKKLNMERCSVQFKSPDDLPLETTGKLISATSSEKWIEFYEQLRSRTKAGQKQKVKPDAASASKVAAKRGATKRRR
jgi:hypothetical protein